MANRGARPISPTDSSLAGNSAINSNPFLRTLAQSSGNNLNNNSVAPVNTTGLEELVNSFNGNSNQVALSLSATYLSNDIDKNGPITGTYGKYNYTLGTCTMARLARK